MSRQLEFEFVQDIPIITICYPISLPAFNRMEDPPNESNIITLRAFLSTTGSRGRAESKGQDDDAG